MLAWSDHHRSIGSADLAFYVLEDCLPPFYIVFQKHKGVALVAASQLSNRKVYSKCQQGTCHQRQTLHIPKNTHSKTNNGFALTLLGIFIEISTLILIKTITAATSLITIGLFLHKRSPQPAIASTDVPLAFAKDALFELNIIEADQKGHIASCMRRCVIRLVTPRREILAPSDHEQEEEADQKGDGFFCPTHFLNYLIQRILRSLCWLSKT